MLFNSYIFIFAFLPLCLAGFYLLKNKWKTAAKLWLIAMSLWFYGYFNLYYLTIMLFSIVFNYLMYGLISRPDVTSVKGDKSKPVDNTNKKVWLIVGVAVNLGVLFYFKYFDFFIANVNAVFGSHMPLKGILLPLGISFFTFQQIGFLTDTYRGEIPECNPVDYALFVSFFPQLIAGPIVNHDEMLPQFARIGDKVSGEKITRGAYIFIMGMAKKVLIADTFGLAVDYAYSNLAYGINATESLCAILFYTLQLYFDFSGYCDMAIGLAGMLGIDIPINFNSPYKAVNIIDFWKRWHITLSRFFTKNIYIPLGGNRKGNVRMYINLFVVFFLSGLWHGAGWNFILWGCMHGILYVITRAWQRRKAQKGANGKSDAASATKVQTILSVILTFIFVNIAWVYFRAESVSQANLLISNLWNAAWTKPGLAFAENFNLPEFWYVLKVLRLTDLSISRYIMMLCMTVFTLCITFFGKNVHERADRTNYGIATALGLGILFVWCVVSLSGVSTFLYFNF